MPLVPLEAVVQRCSVKKVFLEISQNSQENTCARVSFLIKFIKKETLAQVFSCEFYEISKNTFSYRTPPVAASIPLKIMSLLPYVIDGIPCSSSHDIVKLKLSIGTENIKMQPCSKH